MNDSYHRSVEVNTEVLLLLSAYEESDWDRTISVRIFTLLEPITDQVIAGLLARSGLPEHLAPDMKQEAWIKHSEMIYGFFDPERSPSYVSWWRRVITNHLIGLYTREWRHKPIPDDFDVSDPDEFFGLESSDLVDQVRAHFTRVVAGWEAKHDELKPFALHILEMRILQGVMETQPAKADKFGRTQSVVSAWEQWWKKEVRSYLKSLDIIGNE